VPVGVSIGTSCVVRVGNGDGKNDVSFSSLFIPKVEGWLIMFNEFCNDDWADTKVEVVELETDGKDEMNVVGRKEGNRDGITDDLNDGLDDGTLDEIAEAPIVG